MMDATHDRPRTLPTESRPGDSHMADFGEQKVDIYRLIHLAESLNAETVSMADLEKFKDGNYWKDGNDEWLGPHHILNEAAKYANTPDWNAITTAHPAWANEIRKILRADYRKHPIIIVEGIVLDGMHRLTKAWLDRADSITVKKFSKLPEGVTIP